MSADNWTTCPRCLQEAQEAAAQRQQEVSDLYGTVPVEEFDRRRGALVPVDPEKYRTFREDYEIGAIDGCVEWNYRGGCAICSLSTNVKGSERFWDSIAKEPVL